MKDSVPSTPSDRTDSGPGPICLRYDWSSSPPSEAIVNAVAIARDADPVDLPSLYDRVDPDAIDALLRRTLSSVDASDVVITFSYAELEVTVGGDGEITVDSLDG